MAEDPLPTGAVRRHMNRFVELVPPQTRLQLWLGRRPDWRTTQSITVEIDLIESRGVTTVRLVYPRPARSAPDLNQPSYAHWF